ncbi:MAG: peptidoglycan-associated lipoprotein Pal, partial [SAR324 cluster bacterium]|nr:peptidoglycan-associated lipoprotein Pal [SAR324 cluster bacterium]
SSTKEGKIDYRGGCSSSISWANAGTNTITFNELNYMTYSDCTIAVTDSDGVQSEVLEVSAFTVEMKPKPKPEPEPVVAEPEPEPAPAPEPEPVVAEPEPAPAPAPEEVAEIEEAEIAIEKDADESVEAPKPMTIITAPPEEMESAVIEMGMVYFDYDKSNISSTFAEIIEINYEWIAENPDVKIQLEGHCDERGTNEYNLALGERRAKAVFEYLVKLGANPSQFTMVSFGEERPVASGSNEVDWAKNRRVEFTRL